MSDFATIASIWRYPVKSMLGEQLDAVEVTSSGLVGDRVFAFKDPDGRPGFPWVTGRQLREMILYSARFENVADIGAASSLSVTLPDGQRFAVDDPALAALLAERSGAKQTPELVRDHIETLVDCYPVSLFSLQTAHQLSGEVGVEVDHRRFRANFYIDLGDGQGFGEDSLVGHDVRIGADLVIHVAERDARCLMVTLDPDSTEANPNILGQLSKAHDTSAGIYCQVVSGGTVQVGDPVVIVS
ncbi:MAG: MOSC N-terminal beta barrel domain-containing protein [Pseudomonadota bacterium]